MAVTHYASAEIEHQYEGRLERVENTVVHGWVWDKAYPDMTVFVDVLVDGLLLATVAANRERGDLKNAEIGDGCHGFFCALPAWLQDGKEHEIMTRVSGTNQVLTRAPHVCVLDDLASKTEEGSPARLSSNVFYHIPSKPTQLDRAQAIVGKDHWLFLCNDSNRCIEQVTGQFRFSDKQLEQYKRVFCARREKLAKHGIPYVFAIAPTKELVYTDKLPETLHLSQELFPYQQVMHALEEEGFEILSLHDTLIRGKELGQVYHRTDTHWNSLGGYLAYCRIMTELDKYIGCGQASPLDSFKTRQHVGLTSDLSNKQKVAYLNGEFYTIHPSYFDANAFTEEVSALLPHDGFKAKTVDIPEALAISPTRPTVVREVDDASLPTLMVMRDSFATNLIPFLSEHFRRSVYLWHPEPHMPSVEAEKPDIVLQVMVDRFMQRVPDMPE